MQRYKVVNRNQDSILRLGVFAWNCINMKILFLALLILIGCSIKQEEKPEKKSYPSEEEVTKKYLNHHFHYFSPEWQLYLDSAILMNPTVAYFYQQKAMPLYKQRKYEAGLPYLNKAVELDSVRYIDYRGFMKCIFSKDYSGAIQDFTKAKKIKGEHGYVMDHSYDFHLGLSYLQLNDYPKAVTHLTNSIEYTKKQSGESWVHYLDLFYLGIANYELKKYSEAITQFDKSLNIYKNFADAEYYKALSLARLDKKEEAMKIFKQAGIDFREGHTINEDNAYYEKYPYQLSDWFFPKEK